MTTFIKVFTIAVFLISIIQYFRISPFEVFSYYGGNIISGTYLLTVRVNGGISGTAIDFAVLIIQLAFFHLAISMNQKLSERLFWMFLIFCLVMMNFSRVVFVSTIFLIFSYLVVNFFRTKWLVLFVSIIVIFSVVMAAILLQLTDIDIYDHSFFFNKYSVRSDEIRLSQWKETLSQWTNSSSGFLIGESFGRNLGLPESFKTVGDGHFIGFLYDCGIIGFVLYANVFISITFAILFRSRSARVKAIMGMFFISFIFFNLVNSGFDHHLNIILFPVVVEAIYSIRNQEIAVA